MKIHPYFSNYWKCLNGKYYRNLIHWVGITSFFTTPPLPDGYIHGIETHIILGNLEFGIHLFWGKK